MDKRRYHRRRRYKKGMIRGAAAVFLLAAVIWFFTEAGQDSERNRAGESDEGTYSSLREIELEIDQNTEQNTGEGIGEGSIAGDLGAEAGGDIGAAGNLGAEASDTGAAGNRDVGNSGETGAAGNRGAEDSGESGGGQGTGTASADMEEPEITLVMVGDILLHTPVAESGRREDGSYDFGAVFDGMREEIAEADLALVNQEVIIGGEELGISGYPAFNAPYELGDALAEAGFDVVLHATNHALDKGKKGVLNCLAFWEEQYPGMAVLGIHGSGEDQEEIYVYEQEGIRIAVLNYTYGTNGIAMPADMPYAVDMLERERVAGDLQRARELADFVVVCPHWGTEYTLEATAEQRDWALFFADNGADLILGTHPHVIEPVEWVTTSDKSRDVLVYYSLGNFVNWTSGTGTGVANRMVGCMARVDIERDEDGVVIKDYEAEPIVCHVEQGFGGVRVYPLDSYTEELAQKNEIVDQDGEFSLEYCRSLAQEVLGN